MRKILILLFAALFAISAVTPAYASHHRRHHRYYRGGHPIIVVDSTLATLPLGRATRGSWAECRHVEQAPTLETPSDLGVPE